VNTLKSSLALFSLFSLAPLFALAAGVPTSFTYQGKALNAAGTSPLLTTVSFTLSITDPSGACTLYQETQSNINLAPTNGIFALQVGSAIGSAKRTAGTDPGLSMTQVFANAGTQLVAASGACTSGYTPAANDVRKLHVIITPTSGSPITISPDLSMLATPNVMVAETIQGLAPAYFTPVGSVLTTALATCPTGYIAMDGTSYPTATYPALASALNYEYGGSGSSFTVPNSSALFMRSAGSQSLNGISYSATQGGTQNDQFQGHQHTLNNTPTLSFYGGGGGTGFLPGVTWDGPNYTPYIGNPTNDGSNGGPRTGPESRPANIAFMSCIKY
jgi:hypothetical protein